MREDLDGVATGPPVRRLSDWDAAGLRVLAAEYGTPLYVQDLARVRANYRRVDDAFADAMVHYAAKANAGAAVLATLASAGAGVECASAGEVVRALDAGFDPGRVIYTAVNPPARDLDAVVARAGEAPGFTVTAGAADTVDRLAERGYRGRLLVRVHPGVGAGHGEGVATGADPAFGVAPDRVDDLLRSARERGLRPVGLHAHAGSGIGPDDVDAHGALVERLADLVRAAPLDLEIVDVGGGFGVPYGPDEPPVDLEAVAAATREALAGLDVDLVVEPGRYVVADAGVLLTRATTVKDTPAGHVAGVDAGMTTLLRPALYGAHHEVRALAPDAGERPTRRVTLAGPVCESTDVLAADRQLPAPARGDLYAVGAAGAYGLEMASNYTSRPRPAVVVVDGDRVALARERESLAALVADERDPAEFRDDRAPPPVDGGSESREAQR